MHILWVKTELLHPVDKGGRIRSYKMLVELKRAHRITYVCLDDGSSADHAEARAAEYCHELIRVPFGTAPKGGSRFYAELILNLFSPLPYAVAKYRSPSLRRQLESFLRISDPDVLVCDFLAPSINVPVNGHVPSVLFQHNVEAVIWERQAANAADPLKRAYLAQQWRRMRQFEAAECQRFDQVIAVSPQDETIFRNRYGVRRVSSIPTGVDTDYFRPSGRERRQTRELIFIGSMDWLPNEDAVVHFATEILPRIRAEVHDATFTIVGRNPTHVVRALAVPGSGITVTGGVPDVRPFLERGSVFVVPTRIGSGTRLKIFEAMAMECPVVSTTVGAEGLPVTNGQNIRIAEDSESFAAAVVDLILKPERARHLAVNAAAFVRQSCSWAAVTDRFASACLEVARVNKAAGAA